MTIQAAYKQLLATLYELYDNREAANISNWVIEHITGQGKIDRIIYKDLPVSIQQQQLLQRIIVELQTNKPVQYVLNEAWFAGMKLFVNEHVLIPRPETEELIDWIMDDLNTSPVTQQRTFTILDIGTGSGCIPISLKKQLPAVDITALDVSADALIVAGKNAIEQGVAVAFINADFLDRSTWEQHTVYDIIVSNPPYIKAEEVTAMAKNVVDHEPAIALFVPNDDALIFYKAIAQFALQHLKNNGSVYVEINEALGLEVEEMFTSYGFKEVQLKKDLQLKDRMIKAVR